MCLSMLYLLKWNENLNKSWNSKFNVPSLKIKSFTLLRYTDVLWNFLLFLSVYFLCCVSCFCLLLSKFGAGFDSIRVFICGYLHTIQKVSYLSSICSKTSMWFLEILDKDPGPTFSSKFDLGCVLYIGFIGAEKRLFSSLPFLVSGLTCLVYLYHNFQLPTRTHFINLIV